MVSKKRKRKKTKLEVEEKPEITIDLSDESKPEEVIETTDTPAEESSERAETPPEDTIQHAITRLKTRDGVVGYLLKNTKSASIDLKDSTKIVEYATLSSTAFETSGQVLDLFELGSVEQVIITGDTLKLLSFTKGENQVSVFMEKDIDHKRIYKDLQD